MKTQSILTIKVSTEKMFRHFMAVATDLIWGAGNSNIIGDCNRIIHTLHSGNMEGIRDLFKDGYAFQLLPNPQQLETKKNVEIRVYHENELIGVIIDSEISY